MLSYPGPIESSAIVNLIDMVYNNNQNDNTEEMFFYNPFLL